MENGSYINQDTWSDLMDPRKFIAKKIIKSRPFSIEYADRIPRWLAHTATPVDRCLQDWALTESDFFSKCEWSDLQFERLKATLIHAERIMYWGKIFRKRNFDPHSFSRHEDISTLPITSRRDVQAIPILDMVAGNMPAHRRIPARTSGSTGEPLVFYRDSRDFFRRMVGMINNFQFAGVPFAEPLLILGLDTHRQLDRAGFRFSNLENGEARARTLYPFIERFAPQFVVTTPSTLERFLHFLIEDHKSYSFRAVQCIGESMLLERREHLEKIFNARIFSVYGSQECGQIARECEQGLHHLVLWNCYVEILDTAGRPAPTGMEGDIIITGFENEVMPLIRYRLGDRGLINCDACECGRTSPTINFKGRTTIIIRTSAKDGFSISALSTLITVQFGETIALFQLEQTEAQKFIFRYISKSAAREVPDRALLDSLYKLTGRNIDIQIQRVGVIMPAPNGKIPLFIRSMAGAKDLI